MNFKSLTMDELIRYIEAKIAEWASKNEKMQEGIDYYNYRQAIDEKQRAVIGKDGKLVTVRNLPNTIIKDNQYARALDQKRSYVLSKRPNIGTSRDRGGGAVDFATEFMDNRFMRTLNKIATDSYNCGIGWMFVYTDGEDVKFKRLDPLTVIPIWRDDNHDSVEAVIRLVNQAEFEGGEIKAKQYVYFYTVDEINIFAADAGHLEHLRDETYLEKGGEQFSYKKLPFIYFKQPGELPLIDKVRCLQDALNLLLSNYADNLFENPMNSILVIKNYDGTDLGEFRQMLAQYSAVKVRTADGSQGAVETLEVDVNSENYKVIIELIKKAIAHNARSLYLDNDRTNNAPNSLNIKAMYSDMELDANDLELEFTASFEYLFSWIGDVVEMDFSDLDISFKRSIMVNDESTVDMIRNSIGIISDETLIKHHPLVTDAKEEMKTRNEERRKTLAEFDDYQNLGGDFGELLGQKDSEAR